MSRNFLKIGVRGLKGSESFNGKASGAWKGNESNDEFACAPVG